MKMPSAIYVLNPPMIYVIIVINVETKDYNLLNLLEEKFVKEGGVKMKERVGNRFSQEKMTESYKDE